MARPGITFEQVAAVADAMLGNGQQPTINGVRDRIGTGSPNTIHKHLLIWRAARPQTIAATPELPANLATAIATEIERATANARSEVEDKLVQSQAEAVELANAGEVLEAERDELFEQVVELTTHRDTLAGKAEQQAVDIEALEERVKREQQAAEFARVELAKAQLKIESGTEKLVDQNQEIERLRATLEVESKARIAAEQVAAVLTAKLESMTERVTKAEAKVDKLDQQQRELTKELSIASNQVTSQQLALDTSGRELESARKQIKDAKQEAKVAEEKVAELTGRLFNFEKK
jgi:chromosome segregation ATPase